MATRKAAAPDKFAAAAAGSPAPVTRSVDRAYISSTVRRDLWIVAAGRCEFRGCCKPVDRDFLTKARCKVGEYAHIIADSPAGARGVPGESERLNARIIAATHRDLASDVAAGRFREDLFHRLAVGILRLPPLRERDRDVAVLIDHFLEQINSDARGRPEAQDKKISDSARKVLLSYPWPGNVRELYHTLVRASIWSHGATIGVEDARSALLQIQRKSDDVLGRTLTQDFDLKGLLDEVARDYIARALKQSGDRKSVAAELLGFPNYQTFGNWMKRLGVDSSE